MKLVVQLPALNEEASIGRVLDSIPRRLPGVDEVQDGVDEYLGYQAAVRGPVTDLLVGDLIEADEGSGVWVVVDEAVEEDPAAPGHVAVSWRGDGDEEVTGAWLRLSTTTI